MNRILVTGASGLLGLTYCLQMRSRQMVFGVVNQHALKNPPFSQVVCDLNNASEITALLDEVQPEVILHCAAMANIDECEKRPDDAHRLNAWLPGYLAKTARHRGIFLVYISTDAVFDGQKGDYSENDVPNPLSVYAITKLEGERQVLDVNPDSLVVRVNFYGWSLSGKRSLAEWFFNKLSNGEDVNGFTDVVFCPLLVNDLAEILYQMMNLRLQGIYHTVSPQCLSKYEFGILLARHFRLSENLIHPVSWKQGGLIAPRSPNLRLKVDKLASVLPGQLPLQEDGMRRFHELFLGGWREKLTALGSCFER